jgi:serine phosphatase RsbU (regulator of sigma subunit)
VRLLFLLSLLFVKLVFSQNFTRNGRFSNHLFSTADFGSTTQIWTGAQSSNGNIYFGNESTILEYNGVKWGFIKVDELNTSINQMEKINHSGVKKVFTAKNGQTFVARQNNFGLLKYNSNGKVVYHIINQKKKNGVLGTPINIIENPSKGVFFIYENSFFYYDFNSKKTDEIEVKFLKNNHKFHYATTLDTKMFLVTKNGDDYDNILFDYSNFEFQIKTSNFQSIIKNISGIVSKKDYWLLFNKKNEVFILNKTLTDLTKSDYYSQKISKLGIEDINKLKKINNHILIGTEHKGLFILDENFNLVRNISNFDGLESLKVHDFFFDKDNNLWICLDNGIHFFETSSPITYFNKEDGITERIIKIDFNKNNEILATNALGLFQSELINNRKVFKQLSVLNDGVYDVETFQTSFGTKTLIIGNKGIFEIDYLTKKLNLIAKEYSYKLYQNPKNKDEFFVGNETSVGKINLVNNKWGYEIIVPETKGFVISLTCLDDKLIFGARDVGIFIYDLKNKTSRIIKNNIVTSYFVETFQNKVYIGMNTGLYYLNEKLDEMIPFIHINRKFIDDAKFSVFRLFNENDKKLWYVSYKEKSGSDILIETGWIDKSGGNWNATSWPFVWIDYFKGEIIYDIKAKNNDEIWLASSKGLFIFNEGIFKKITKKFNLEIDEIHLNKDLKAYNPKYASKLEPIEYSKNSVKFVFHANSTLGLKEMRYRYKLLEYDDSWSNWSNENEAFYQKIPEGNYQILIEAKNIYGFKSEVLKYDFVISPPWFRTWWAYSLYVLMLILTIYGITQLSIRRIKNQNLKLEAIVEERTSEIADQNKVLAEQKLEIEHKTKDIVDSIIYAKRIQETILPKERLVNMFEDYFVFYRPKDIVSGDFYWARKKGDVIIFAAIDCTGHGVPGALVSIVGNGALLRCVNEHKLIEPAEILEKLREIVVKSFDTRGEQDVKDGMDMSLCTYNTVTRVLKYAGANNECIVIRQKNIIELKPDKQPIGYFSHATNFTQKEMILQSGDAVYQYTDGVVDQFGGSKGKKLKSKPFKEFLIEISHHNMVKQNHLIQEMFDKWKDGFDQVDDVCVFGIKIV